MKKIIVLTLFAVSLCSLHAQGNYITKKGIISFYSHTAIEDITAINNEAGSIINSGTGEVVITLAMKDFNFEKKLMQEHFNENYVESEKYPKATFKGFIVDNEKVDYSKKSVYPVTVEGDMTIHGVTNKVKASGTIEVTKGGVTARSKFNLNPEHYEIKIPSIVRENIAKEMEISAELNCEPM